MLQHRHISISRFYPIIWSHWSPHSSSPLLPAPPDHSIDQSCRHGNLKRPKVGVQWAVVGGGAGAVTDRDVVWGRSASWSPQITMFWLVTRCNAVTRCHGDKYYCHVTCVHNVPVSTNNMLGVGAVHLGTSAWEEYTHWRYTKLTLSGTFKELL